MGALEGDDFFCSVENRVFGRQGQTMGDQLETLKII